MNLSSDFTKRIRDADPAAGPADPPTKLIGALLRIPHETVRDRMLSGLHERGFTDLVPAHLNLMLWPGPENQRPSDLAAQTHMSKQALNYLLGQLERLGYLTRRADPDDQRSKRIHVTSRGRAAGQAAREIVHEVEVEWERRLGPRKFAQLREILLELQSTEPDVNI